MSKTKTGLIVLTIICVVATALGMYVLGGVDSEKLEAWLQKTGVLAPIIYVGLYTIGTLLILPSTPLNLAGGALFGVWWGTFWTTLAAIIAALVAFAFTRTIGREYVARKFAGKWEAIDAEMKQGGLFYMFAIRLLPIIPYGLVNFAAGLTSIRFRDYLIGTSLGTIPGILPFVMIGAGLKSFGKGDRLPLMVAFTLVGVLVGVGTWYRRRRQKPKIQEYQEEERSHEENQ
ncbi:MAG: TVP38/TMEM64 family inner membrane protein YdjZ [Chroococcopsis gigantea SAG 12.99]|nr:TVP38/TMEM64 family inner membrane protein YdjZ [Chroococcopsis gigantea SAG 12.99]